MADHVYARLALEASQQGKATSTFVAATLSDFVDAHASPETVEEMNP